MVSQSLVAGGDRVDSNRPTIASRADDLTGRRGDFEIANCLSALMIRDAQAGENDPTRHSRLANAPQRAHFWPAAEAIARSHARNLS